MFPTSREWPRLIRTDGRGVNVDMIVQNISSQGVTDISFTVPANSATTAVEVAEKVAADIGADGVDLIWIPRSRSSEPG